MRYLVFGIYLAGILTMCGCQSIHLGGSGDVGGVRAGGGVSIPVPR